MHLTPNRRLAIFLSKQSAEPVLSFHAWLETIWQTIQNDYPEQYPKLLTRAEQEILWEKIIYATQSEAPLLRTSSTARLASEAWNACHQWQVPLFEGNITDDSHAYCRWAKEYQSLCQANHWIDSAQLLDHIRDLIEQGTLSPPPTLSCTGFEEWTPQQQRFLDSCRQKNSSIEFHSLISEIGEVSRLPVRSKEEELEFAAKATKYWLAEYPLVRIGIIIPDLEYRRFEVERIFKEQLSEETFNIAAPLSLFEYPLIQSILLGLKLMLREIPFATISQYLRLPFFGQAQTEAAERAALEVLLRDKRKEHYTLESFIFALESCLKKLPEGCGTHLLASLKEVAALRTQFRGKRTAEVWKDICRELLNRLGWPGERPLNEEEYQLKEQWDTLLIEYIQMGRVLGEHSYGEAISHIQRLSKIKQFLPSSQLGAAPVQILGLLEAMGLPFDYLWVVGLHRDTWPTDPSPNPYIPLALQRSLGLPRSSANRELQVAKRITQQLCMGGKTVIFSYPYSVDDHITSVSSLLIGYPELSAEQIEPLGLTLVLAKKDAKEVPLDSAVENTLSSSVGDPVVNPSLDINTYAAVFEKNSNSEAKEAELVTFGGSRILKLQAACPFRAFADIRLKAKPLTSVRLGLNASERGDILHQCLLDFWKGLNSQDELNALSDHECCARTERVVSDVFEKWRLKFPHLLTPQYLLLEKTRTEALIQKFIQLEKLRSPFEVVGVEVEQKVVLGGVHLRFRIDRIDRLENGEELLIDYKTGRVHISEWFGARPRDPQLPLYCITRRPNPSGVAFGIIRPDTVKFQGLSAIEDCLPGIHTPTKAARYGSAETWDAQYAVWEKDMEKLAYEFRMGKAEVDPIDGETTCRTCHLKAICRVQR
jgi:ATP-dependent helicase/nuclease subunit B